MPQRARTLVPALILAAAAAAAADLVQVDLPIASKGAVVVYAQIEPAGDVDSYSVFLSVGDVLTASSREVSPAYGLFSTLSLTDPNGADPHPTVKGQGKQRAVMTFTAKTAGVHVITLNGEPAGGGSHGTYQFSLSVRRAKVPVTKLQDPAGAAIVVPFTAQSGSTVTITGSTRKGGLDLTEVRRPDGTAEPGLAAALRPRKNRRSATINKLALTGGNGAYSVRGAYDAGSVVTLRITLATNEKRVTRRLNDEPRFDPLLPPFPSVGIGGTFVNVAGQNFDAIPIVDNAGKITGYTLPTFTVGGFAVPASSVTHPNGSIYRFPVPGGLAASSFYDMTAVDQDGQGVKLVGAFYVVPPPQITGLSVTTAGPAGGRSVRINGIDLRPNTTVVFDSTFVQPTTSRPTYLDVTAPAHAPGDVVLSIRDEFGQTAAAPVQFTYLNIGSNRITTVFPPTLMATGGETVAVRGADFGGDSVLTLDGVVQGVTLVSNSMLTFVPTTHADATVKLRVTDSYQQTSAVDVRLKGFADVTNTVIPTPVATANGVDGWRASRVLVGDVNGDGRADLVLLRPEQAFGNDVNRPRLRVLLADGAGGFTDATATKIPAVSGDEDWRGKDGVLVDLDGDNDLDIAIVTDEPISGGARPSLRVLKNNGSGTFTDATATAVPAATSYGDRCQGVALAAANLDGVAGADLVIVHTDFFTDAAGPTYFPGTRVLTNDGSGVFSRKANAIPAVTPSGPTQYQGDAVAVADVTGDGKADIFVTRLHPQVDPANPTQYVRAARLLANNASAVFTDVSATNLPAPSDPEYMQGTRAQFVDLDGDGDRDIVLASVIRVVSPVTGQTATTPSLRLFANNGSGGFTALTNVLPAADDLDQLQADGFVVGDITGRGKADILVVSARAPNQGARGGRLLVAVGGAWQVGSKGLPDYLTGDDLRGASAALVDVDGDGALDVVVVRDETDETARNTRVLRNPLKDFVNVTATAVPAPVTTANGVDGWRAKRVLSGDVNGDGRPDLVLLRPEKASGNDANRSRIRLFTGGVGGVFTDATTSSLPGVSGDEDWRAKDGVLADLDGDGDLDLAVITDEPVSGGTRSSLRVLRNTGGVFSDVTTTNLPAPTAYGDLNQGVAVAAGRRPVGVAPNVRIVVDLVILNPTHFVDLAGPTHYAATRVMENNGAGSFSRKANALPAVSATSATQYQGVSLAAADVNNDGFYDILVERGAPPVDPLSPGAYVRAVNLLVNDGNQVFGDVSAAKLPAASEPEYMQGDRVYLADVDGDARPDIVVASASRVTSPITSLPQSMPATRIFLNDGAGTFSAMAGGTLPAADGSDYLQSSGAAFGDVTGDGRPDILLVSQTAPNGGGRGGRLFVNVGGSWLAAPKMLPDPSALADDLRGVDAAFADIDADGDLDAVLVRNEANDAVKNAIVLKNTRK